MHKVKTLLWSVAFLALSGVAHAVGGTQPALTYQVGVSSITTVIISVSTTTATQMDNPTLQARAVVEIENIDSTANLWCLPTSSPTVNGGRKISAGSSWVVSMRDRVYVPNDPTRLYSASNTNFYCLSDGAGATTKAAVTQLY